MGNINVSVSSRIQGQNIIIGIEGLETVSKALGDLNSKTPAAIKVAVNQTARQTRKWMIAAAKARYVVNAAGARHLNDLEHKKKATNSAPSATLFIAKMRNDLGYFENNPALPFSGMDVFTRSPEFYQARVLASSSLAPLTGKGNLSKGFLARFKSGHVGMVQRVIGSSSRHTTTENGRPRWRNRAGNVEKLQTMGAPSATAMHTQVWPDVQEDVEAYLADRLQERVNWIVERAKGR